MDKNFYRESGFTLLEILIVTIIIAITAAIAISSHRKTIERASLHQAEALLEMIYDAEQYYQLEDENNNYVYGVNNIKDLESIDGNDIEALKNKGFNFDFDQTTMMLKYDGCTLSIDISGERSVDRTEGCTFE